MIRRLPLCLLAALAVGLAIVIGACTAETGPDAPKRTNSGCIDTTCTFDAALLPTDPGEDSGAKD